MQVETRNIFSFSYILVLGRIKMLEEGDSHRRALLLPLHMQFFSAASIIMHSFLKISSMRVKNNLLSRKIFESKAGTKVSVFADTELVCEVTSQVTDTTYASTSASPRVPVLRLRPS